jgi:hypothetical protein
VTKLRDPLSFSAAIHAVATAIGMQEAARLTGRAVRTVQHWSESDRSGTPTLDQAIALDKAFMAAGGGSSPILECFTRQMEIYRVQADACRLALAQDVAELSREAGDAISHCIQALQPGSTPADIRDAIVETEQVDAILPRLIGRLKALQPRNLVGREATGVYR